MIGVEAAGASQAVNSRLGRAWRSKLPEWLTLFAYTAFLAYQIPRHEPWADEAQAWQLARTVPLPQLFSHYLRYEGHPGLWHLLLAGLLKLHVSYAGMHWFAGAIAIAGVFLLIFFSPFHPAIRLTLPFTFFLAFQYAVVARSYVLVPILLFGVAMLWRRSPIFVALLLGLLGNVSMHVLAISGGFALVYLIEIWREHRPKKEDPRVMLIATLILLVSFGFALWTVLPQPPNVRIPGHHSDGLLLEVPVWLIISLLSLGRGVAQPGILAAPLWIFLTLRFRRAGCVFYLLPIATFALFSGFYFSFWHAGLLIPATIAACWIAWPELHSLLAWRPLAITVCGLIAMQIVWTGYAAAYHPYSSAPETARFLMPYVVAGETIAVTYVYLEHEDINSINAYHSIALYPYFDHPIFVNQPRPFWLWSTKEHTFDQFKQTMEKNPAIVVAVFWGLHRFNPSQDLQGPRIGLLEKKGYRLTHTFCGEKPQGFGWHEETCDLIFERSLPGVF